MLLVHNHHVVVPKTEDLYLYMPTYITKPGTERQAYEYEADITDQTEITLAITPRSIYWVEVYINGYRLINHQYPTHGYAHIPFEDYNLFGNRLIFTKPIRGRVKVIVDTVGLPLPENNPDPAVRGLTINFVNIQSYDEYIRRFTPARYASGSANVTIAANVNVVGWNNSALVNRVGDSLYSEPLVLHQPDWGYVRPTSDRRGLLYVPKLGYYGYDCFTYTMITQHGQIGPAKTVYIKVYADPPPPRYTLSADRILIPEGEAYTITLETESVEWEVPLAFTITGANVTATDLGLAALTGTFVPSSIGNGTIAQDSITSIAWFDNQREGDEPFTITLDDHPEANLTLIISDVNFNLLANVGIATEGNTVLFTLESTGVPNGTVYAYTMYGTNITSGDIVGGVFTGNFVVNNNVATTTRRITRDYIKEGVEQLTIELVQYPFVSNTISIVDTSPVITVNPANIMRGETVTFTLLVPDADEGRQFAYRLRAANTTVTSGETGFVAATANFVVASGSATATFNTPVEIYKDLGGTFAIELIEDTDVVSPQVTLADRTYYFTSNRQAQGTVVRGTVEAQSHISDAAQCYVKINGTSIAHTFTQGYTIAVVNPDTFALTSVAVVDSLAAGSATGIVGILNSAANGSVIAIVSHLGIVMDAYTRSVINDNLGTVSTTTAYSLNGIPHVIIGTKTITQAPIEAFEFGNITVNPGIYNLVEPADYAEFVEGQYIGITLSTTGFITGAQIPFAITGRTANNDITSNDFVPPVANVFLDSMNRTTAVANVSGYLTVLNGNATVTYQANLDNKFEGGPTSGERFDVELVGRPVTPNYNQQIYTVYIRDPAPTFNLVASSTTVNEGDNLDFYVYTTSVADNTVLYYKVTNIAFKDWVINSSPTFTTVNHPDAATYAEAINRYYWVYFGRYADQAGLDFWVGSIVNGGLTIEQVENFLVSSPEAITANGNVRTGTVTITNNYGLIDGVVVEDFTTEGNETLIMTLYTDSFSGPVVDTESVLIIDTSQAPTYTFTANDISVNEGETVRFTANTTHVLNYTSLFYRIQGNVSGNTVGNITASDFTDNSLTGNILIVNNTGYFDKTFRLDEITESVPSNTLGSEVALVNLYKDSNHTILLGSVSVTVFDTSRLATYSIVPIFGNVITEGGQQRWIITTTGLFDGSQLYWTNSGTTVAADFVENVNSGIVTITNNGGQIILRAFNDLTTEGDQWVNINLRTDSITGNIVANSEPVLVRDTSLTPPTYRVVPDASSKSEGQAITWTITTTDVANNTEFWWSVIGTGIEIKDMVLGTQLYADTTGYSGADITVSNSLSVTINGYYVRYLGRYADQGGLNYYVPRAMNGIQSLASIEAEIAASPESTAYVPGTIAVGNLRINNSSANISGIVVADLKTEGTETAQFTLFTDSARTNSVASNTVVIVDTSLTPPATFAISPNVITVNEGGTIRYTITTTNVPNNSYVYLRNLGTTVGTDFVTNQFIYSDSGLNFARTTITNNSGIFDLQMRNDVSTEGPEWVNVAVAGLTTTSNIVANATPVQIIDTSLTMPTFVLTANVAAGGEVNYGDSVRFTANTTSIPDGATLEYRITGDVLAEEIVGGLTGTFTVNALNYINGSGQFTLTTVFSSNRPGGTLVAVNVQLYFAGAPVGNIRGFSIRTIAQWRITENASSIDEDLNNYVGVTIRITAFQNENEVSTVPNYLNWPVYWRNLGTASAVDFTAGGVNVNEGTLSLSREVASTTVIGGVISYTYKNAWSKVLNINAVADITTEGPETIQIAVYQSQADLTAEVTGNVITITDTSITQNVIISHNYVSTAGAPNETTFRSLVVSVYTLTSFPAGRRLYWDVTGSVTASDFSSALTGSWIPSTQFYTSDIPGYRLWRVSFSIVEDQITEGTENMIFNVRLAADPGTNPPIAGSAYSISVSDTSLTRFLSMTPNTVSIDEGQSLVVTVTGNNYPIGTELASSALKIFGDFRTNDLGPTGFFFTVNSDPFTFNIPAIEVYASGGAYEGPEQFVMRLHQRLSGQTYAQAITNPVIATTPVITINDTSYSLTAVVYYLYPTAPYSTNGQVQTAITVLESSPGFDSVISVYVTIGGLAAGGNFYWSTFPSGTNAYFNAVRDSTNYDDQTQNGGGTVVYAPNGNNQHLLRILVKDSAENRQRGFRLQFGPDYANRGQWNSGTPLITILAD